ncbi:MAG: hypothetical protein B6D70_10145 [gamma proteobacterium symbiont of Stewartia floridana]|nr:MAG: hypothetical protein B6D75_16130 [gamma proteobacterium symbiont of Stewartia floridana]RLW60860.1 MAG: hypothetical protein B6D70_10145 [gamma proteobacterium symbiont of Stewartia floridana]RLW63400.1 MAG: hypothetical protein B6D73_15630 [gamma proteobacterium symbiont of Stewartia floridana]
MPQIENNSFPFTICEYHYLSIKLIPATSDLFIILENSLCRRLQLRQHATACHWKAGCIDHANHDSPIPRDEHHLHYDNGETEAVVDLQSGTHRLQLLLGDEDHRPKDPVLMSEKISVRVKE